MSFTQLTASAYQVRHFLWRVEAGPVLQVPERNGVTSFALRKYLDERLYPNLALVHVALNDVPGEQDGEASVAKTAAQRRQDALVAAKNPCTQRETYRLWEGLGKGGTYEQCGWLRDKYGLSWQITPRILNELCAGPDKAKSKRVTDAMMTMVKLDIAGLEAAAKG